MTWSRHLSLFHLEWWFLTRHYMEGCHILSYHSPHGQWFRDVILRGCLVGEDSCYIHMWRGFDHLGIDRITFVMSHWIMFFTRWVCHVFSLGLSFFFLWLDTSFHFAITYWILRDMFIHHDHLTLLSIVTLILSCLFLSLHMYRLAIVYRLICHDCSILLVVPLMASSLPSELSFIIVFFLIRCIVMHMVGGNEEYEWPSYLFFHFIPMVK